MKSRKLREARNGKTIISTRMPPSNPRMRMRADADARREERFSASDPRAEEGRNDRQPIERNNPTGLFIAAFA